MKKFIDEKSDKINFNKEEKTKEAVNLINNMIQSKVARLAGEDKNPNNTLTQEKSAMCIASTSAIPYIEKSMKGNWSLAPLPTYKEDVQLYYGTNVAALILAVKRKN